jgi:hypothetical protein
MVSRDYAASIEPLWSESSTALELARNGMLEFFSNSFLVFAARSELKGVAFDQLAILYSSSRKRAFATQTRIVEQPDRSWVVSKRARQGSGMVDRGVIKLVDTDSPWQNGLSLQTQICLRSMSGDLTLEQIFAPCRGWVEFLSGQANVRNGLSMLDGSHIDSIWQNAYFEAGELRLVDREWIWHEEIPLKVLIIRGIYYFLAGAASSSGSGKALAVRSGRSLIEQIAAALGERLDRNDFDAFVKLEAEIQHIVFGTDKRRQRTYLHWFLVDRVSLRLFQRFRQKVAPILARIRSRLT